MTGQEGWNPYAFLNGNYRNAEAWTNEYMRLHGDKLPDRENLIGWFTNAIETQHVDDPPSTADTVSVPSARWQDISTAPKDGSAIRLMTKNCHTGVGSFAEHEDGAPPFWRMKSKDIGWSIDNPPTHWMPLPPPPTITEEG